MPFKILDDDEPDLEPLIRQAFRRQVRSQELSLLFARNGIEALAALEESRDVDLVLTHLNMPEMDGLTLLAKLGDLKRLLKAVIVSAYGDLENIRAAMNRGAADFLIKPIDLKDLEVTIEKTLKEVVSLREALSDRDQLLTIRHELEIASSIQQSILPRTFPPCPERSDVDVFAEMFPAPGSGGDFYDFFLVEPGRLGFLVADVSGKGVPAALFMAVSRTLLKSVALEGLAPDACLARLNRLLCLDNAQEMFVTAFYGILDLASGEIVYANGGHNPPYWLCGATDAVPLESPGGTVLGVLEHAEYKAKTVKLDRGDSILVYSDGVTEAMDPTGRLFSDARLCDLLGEVDRGRPRSVVSGVIDAVRSYAGGAPQSDDITALAVRYVG